MRRVSVSWRACSPPRWSRGGARGLRASKADVQLVQGEVVLLKAEMARRDSARAAQLDRDHPGAAADHGLAQRHATLGRAGPGRSLHRPLQHPAAAGAAAGAHGPEPAAAHRAPHPAGGAGRADGGGAPFRATARGPTPARRHRVGGPDVRGVAGAAPARKSLHRPPWLAGDAAPVPHQRAGAGRALFHRPELRLGESRFRGRLLPRGGGQVSRRRLGPRPRSTTSASWPSGGRTWQAPGTRTSG